MNQQPRQRRGLGRGLGSLIPTAPPEQASARAEETGPTAAPTHGGRAESTAASHGGGWPR